MKQRINSYTPILLYESLQADQYSGVTSPLVPLTVSVGDEVVVPASTYAIATGAILVGTFLSMVIISKKV